MAIDINKKTGINLSKGSSISLEKNGKILTEVCIGMNWGGIVKKGFLGLTSCVEAVDLDGSVAFFDSQGMCLDTVYYRKLVSDDQAVKHSGDDRSGDSKKDDGLDNEVIQVLLTKINPDVSQIVFFLNSFLGQSFSKVPYAKIRVFEGNKKEVKDVLATFNLATEAQFEGKVGMVMGKLVRTKSNWDFKAIGAPVATKEINATIDLIQKSFLG